MKIFDEIVQGSAEWWAIRKGVPTSSQFNRICTPATGKLATGRFAYMDDLLAEVAANGDPEALGNFTSNAMQRGIDTEPEARAWYAFQSPEPVREVGFVLDRFGRFGCSPDALVGSVGGCEIKCPTLAVQIKRLRMGVLPAEYIGQVHGSLLVNEQCEWWDFISYCVGLPTFRVRVYRDEHTEKLGACLETFWGEWEEMKSRDVFAPLFEN